MKKLPKSQQRQSVIAPKRKKLDNIDRKWYANEAKLYRNRKKESELLLRQRNVFLEQEIPILRVKKRQLEKEIYGYDKDRINKTERLLSCKRLRDENEFLRHELLNFRQLCQSTHNLLNIFNQVGSRFDLGYMIKRNMHQLFDRMTRLFARSHSFPISETLSDFSEENEKGELEKTLLENMQKYLCKDGVQKCIKRDRMVLKSSISVNGKNRTFRVDIKDINVPKDELVKVWISLSTNSEFREFLKSIWSSVYDNKESEIGLTDVKLENSDLLSERNENLFIWKYTENNKKAFMLFAKQELLVFNEEEKREEEAVLIAETYMPTLDIELNDMCLRGTNICDGTLIKEGKSKELSNVTLMFEIEEIESETNYESLDGLSIVEIVKQNNDLPNNLLIFADLFTKKCELTYKYNYDAE